MFELLMSVEEDSSPMEIKEKFEEFISMREEIIKNEIKKLVIDD